MLFGKVRPRKRWMDGVKYDMTSCGVTDNFCQKIGAWRKQPYFTNPKQ